MYRPTPIPFATGTESQEWLARVELPRLIRGNPPDAAELEALRVEILRDLARYGRWITPQK